LRGALPTPWGFSSLPGPCYRGPVERYRVSVDGDSYAGDLSLVAEEIDNALVGGSKRAVRGYK